MTVNEENIEVKVTGSGHVVSTNGSSGASDIEEIIPDYSKLDKKK